MFVVNSDENRETNEDVGAALWCAFNYIADESDSTHAFASLISVCIDDIDHIKLFSEYSCNFPSFTHIHNR